MPAPGPRMPATTDTRLLGAAFAAAVLAAGAAALLLPPPAAPRGSPALLAPRAGGDAPLAARPDDPAALRAEADRLRAAGRPLQLAALLERLHALTGEPASLREAMALRAGLGDGAAVGAALERLAALGVATAEETGRLAGLRLEAGDAPGAAALLLRALAREPDEELALQALHAAARLPDPGPAMRAMAEALSRGAPHLLEPLRRILMEDARPDLALALMEGLPREEQEAPATVFRMAEAEARLGHRGTALTRLMALRVADGLPPGAGALLVELALKEGRLEAAFDVAAQLPPEGWTPGLPGRLREAARAARPELVRRLDPARLAARPEAAAAIALARGDRNAAGRFARAALERPGGTAEGSRATAAVLRELGQDGPAWERLRQAVERPTPSPAAIRLFAELSALTGRAGAALPVLERLRDASPPAGEAWLRLALQEDRRAEAAAFLRGGGAVPAAALADALSLAAALRDAPLADAAAAALRSRRDLPEGWTLDEAAVTAALAKPLTPAALGAALDLLGWASEAEARRRVTRLLAAAPGIGGAAAALDTARHPAIPRLRREAEAGEGEEGIARLALLAVLAPGEARPVLARRAERAAALRARAAQPGTGAEERQEIARRLIELGDPDGAERARRGGGG
jgi:catechol 2,3-dioxygenase-like lactoylglutathione lyase family enzyme